MFDTITIELNWDPENAPELDGTDLRKEITEGLREEFADAQSIEEWRSNLYPNQGRFILEIEMADVPDDMFPAWLTGIIARWLEYRLRREGKRATSNLPFETDVRVEVI